MARQGQRPHNNHWLKERRDESCSGAVGRAYRREQVEGRQRWIVIGEYCDGCHTFWPLKALSGRRKPVRSIRNDAAPTSEVGAEEEVVPVVIRMLRGETIADRSE